ncbi:antitoxin Xre/MbcA/ParS toxin-binding domain-containing protein [Hoeflea sp.]|uniref:type II RES/Xre toxin-antitoxin system antitoxin n=1 Tax=Hoeflea sp. TaxID=1940281 RepID=UPI003A94D577
MAQSNKKVAHATRRTSRGPSTRRLKRDQALRPPASFPEPVRRIFCDQRINRNPITYDTAPVVNSSSDFLLEENETFSLWKENTGQKRRINKTYAKNVLHKIGFRPADFFKIVLSRQSFSRIDQSKEQLNEAETERAFRLASIYEHAVRVFGSKEKAHRWLRKPCRALDGAIPLDLLASETGAHIVESELHAIDHGMFA